MKRDIIEDFWEIVACCGGVKNKKRSQESPYIVNLWELLPVAFAAAPGIRILENSRKKKGNKEIQCLPYGTEFPEFLNYGTDFSNILGNVCVANVLKLVP